MRSRLLRPQSLVKVVEGEHKHISSLYEAIDIDLYSPWSGMASFMDKFLAESPKDVLPLSLPIHDSKQSESGHNKKPGQERLGICACHRLMVWTINALYCSAVKDDTWGRLKHNGAASALQ